MLRPVSLAATLTCALAIAAPNPAIANCDWQPDRFSILLSSDHVGEDQELQEFNPGGFVTWHCNSFELTAGGYLNTYGNHSNAAIVAYPVYENDWLTVSPFVGLATYPERADLQAFNFGDVVPLIGIQLQSGYVFLNLLPGSGQTEGHNDENPVKFVAAAGLTFDLGGP